MNEKPPLSQRIGNVMLNYDHGVPIVVDETIRTWAADARSLEAEVERLSGTTRFETVPKEEHDRTLDLLQDAVDALADPHKMSLGTAALSRIKDQTGIIPKP